MLKEWAAVIGRFSPCRRQGKRFPPALALVFAGLVNLNDEASLKTLKRRIKGVKNGIGDCRFGYGSYVLGRRCSARQSVPAGRVTRNIGNPAS